MNRPILIEVSPGELLDRASILQIKTRRFRDPLKLTRVRDELASLSAALAAAMSEPLRGFLEELTAINEALWDVEDELRACEQRQEFGERFIELARSVYRLNDRRYSIKQRINGLAGSRFHEEKEYACRPQRMSQLGS